MPHNSLLNNSNTSQSHFVREMDNMRAPQKVKPKCLSYRLVVGCSINPSYAVFFKLDLRQTKNYASNKVDYLFTHYLFDAVQKQHDWQLRPAHDWAGGCEGWNLMPWFLCLVTTVQTLALNDVKSARWQRPYSKYFGLIFAKWVDVAHRPPSLLESMVSLVISVATNHSFWNLLLLSNQKLMCYLRKYFLCL